jgi:ribosome-binding protein aMBF1 (putative translation factor)
MAKRKTLMDDIRAELRDDAELRALYEDELSRLQIANQIVKLRERRHLSQGELADRIGTKQAGIARMERNTYRGHKVGTLAKIAAATGSHLVLKFVPDRAWGGRPALRRA